MRRVVVDIERIRKIIACRLADIIEELVARDLLESHRYGMRVMRVPKATSYTRGY